MHALIIEDESFVALAIEDALLDCGYSTFEFAATEGDAIAAAKRHCPDLITAEVSLDAGNGIAAVRAICRNKAIPVVFITSADNDIREHDPDAMIVAKPFSIPELERAVATIAASRADGLA